MINDLSIKIDDFIERGSLDLFNNILVTALELNNEESLSQVLRLVDSNYGGYTYKWELKYTAGVILINWGEKGIDGLLEVVNKNPSHPNISVTSTLLALIASGKLEACHLHIKHLGVFKNLDLASNEFKKEKLKLKAQSALVDLTMIAEEGEKFTTNLAFSSAKASLIPEIQEPIFAALVMRWFHFNNLNIEAYKKLISGEDKQEIVYHNFLKQNTYLLEPFHSQIWSKPRFGELYQPDFLIKSIDNSYTVVEIEKPHLPILTKSGNLSSEATHAKRQTLEYRQWAMNNYLYAKENYPGIQSPFSLVIIGMESNLTPEQKERLRQENESTQGILKIVGFDWIYERAKATFENLVKYSFERNNN
jgi:hypothetical protein